MCETCSATRAPYSRRNPQSNVIIERTHVELLNRFRSLELSNPVWENEERIWDICLAQGSWTMQSTHNTTLKYISGELAF